MATANTPTRKRAPRKTAPNTIGINDFFAGRLRAPINNPRWSWGAYDPSTDTVFMRF